MESLPHDFVSLPIIITDWDAVTKAKSQLQIPTVERERSHTATKTNFDAGLTESVEAIWKRLSDATKIKIRDAANEVLRRTSDDSSSMQQEMGFQYDNDARLLD